MHLSAFSVKLIASAALIVAGSASAGVHTNVPNGASNSLVFAYFGSDTPVGEVFSVSANATLSSFSFYAIGNVSPSVQLNVAQWNPATNVNDQLSGNAVGANLISKTVASQSFNASTGVTEWAFDNLGVNLNANTKYIAYLSTTDANAGGIQMARTQTYQDSTSFGAGHAYYSTIPGVGWSFPFRNSGNPGNGFLSLQYSAITAAVPEPESYALLLAGMGLIGAAVKRRKSKQV